MNIDIVHLDSCSTSTHHCTRQEIKLKVVAIGVKPIVLQVTALPYY